MPQNICSTASKIGLSIVIINFDLYKGSSSVCGPVKLTDLTKIEKPVVVKMTLKVIGSHAEESYTDQIGDHPCPHPSHDPLSQMKKYVALSSYQVF